MVAEHAIARKGAGLRDGQDSAGQQQLAVAEPVGREQLVGIDIKAAGNTIGKLACAQGPCGWAGARNGRGCRLTGRL